VDISDLPPLPTGDTKRQDPDFPTHPQPGYTNHALPNTSALFSLGQREP